MAWLSPAKNRAGEKKGWGVRRQRINDDDDRAQERRDKPYLRFASRKEDRTAFLSPPQRQKTIPASAKSALSGKFVGW